MQKKTDYYRRFIPILGGRWFFRAIVALLVLQASWIALSGLYPMAFDEDFHLGIIRLYAQHLSPFWSGQPEGANMFGAVARDPSYLYHYLMSFPYRLISVFTSNQAAQVLILRFINIGFFTCGLVLYRRLLLKTGISTVIVNLSLLVLVLLPVVPLLAAQINYDNLMLPLTALCLLLAVSFDRSLVRQKEFDLKNLLLLVIVGLLTCLVKYPFLPLFLMIALYLAVRILRFSGSVKELRIEISGGWERVGLLLRVGLIAALIVVGGLFSERYLVNLVGYHTPVADCSQVLSIEQCSEYPPWIRDHILKDANKITPAATNPLSFANEWFYGMWFRTFFAVDGPRSNFQTTGPLTAPGIGAIILAVISALAFAVTAPRLFRKYNFQVLWLFVVVTIGYIAVLWLDGYQAYVSTGHPVAINGRYLLPVMPLMLIVAGTAVSEILGSRRRLKVLTAAAAILCLLWGGGALTYILRSDDGWYWPYQSVRTANHAVQRTLGPVTPGYHNTTQFLR